MGVGGVADGGVPEDGCGVAVGVGEGDGVGVGVGVTGGSAVAVLMPPFYGV